MSIYNLLYFYDILMIMINTESKVKEFNKKDVLIINPYNMIKYIINIQIHLHQINITVDNSLFINKFLPALNKVIFGLVSKNQNNGEITHLFSFEISLPLNSYNNL